MIPIPGATPASESTAPHGTEPNESTPQSPESPSAQTLPDGNVSSDRGLRRKSERFAPVEKMFQAISSEVAKMFVGQDELVLGTLTALFSGGHVLIESVPGLGKTLFVRTLGRALGCEFGRIQFTADLMPSDITGAPCVRHAKK